MNIPEGQPSKEWTWETAYRKWFILRFTLLLIALALSIILAYLYYVNLPEYKNLAAIQNASRVNLRVVVKTATSTQATSTAKVLKTLKK
jgi:hypothetical protein